MSESIFSRYSCRKFSEKPVTEEQLTAIARAGMCAPTARNERPWEFLIVRSKEEKRLQKPVLMRKAVWRHRQ